MEASSWLKHFRIFRLRYPQTTGKAIRLPASKGRDWTVGGRLFNYTGYGNVINGIMVDVAHIRSIPTVAYIEFHMDNDEDRGKWPLAAPPAGVSVRPGAGGSGFDWVTIIWRDGLIWNTWLKITAAATVAPVSMSTTCSITATRSPKAVPASAANAFVKAIARARIQNVYGTFLN